VRLDLHHSFTSVIVNQMETTVKHLSDTSTQFTITLGPKELAAAEASAIRKVTKNIKVPGFRAGKVPQAVAAKHVDAQVLQEQLLDDAISKSVAEAFVEKEIQPIDRPNVDIKKYVPGEMLEFTAEVAVLPKIKLGNYKKLAAKKVVIKVEEAEIAGLLERMQAGFAKKEAVSRPAELTDEVTIDFVGKRDEVAFDGGTATDYALVLGSQQFIPGFEEGIVGHSVGETFDLKLKFPKEYQAADLAGKPVVFTVTLSGITSSTLPELDDQFAAQAGPFTTMKELKADIMRELIAQKERESSDKWKDALISELIEKSTVTAPEILVADQMKSIEQDFQQNLTYRGLSIDAYVESQGFKDADDWREQEVKPTAVKRVQAGLVLSEVTKAEAITLTEKEINDHVEIHKQQYLNDPETLKRFETNEVRRDVANHYMTEKTIGRLVELNGGAAAHTH